MKPFPRHNAIHEPGTSFNKSSWLLMWEVDGEMQCYTDRGDIELTCAEWDRDPRIIPVLESATAPREEILILKLAFTPLLPGVQTKKGPCLRGLCRFCLCFYSFAKGGTRTPTALRPQEPESCASTNSTTLAHFKRPNGDAY